MGGKIYNSKETKTNDDVSGLPYSYRPTDRRDRFEIIANNRDGRYDLSSVILTIMYKHIHTYNT